MKRIEKVEKMILNEEKKQQVILILILEFFFFLVQILTLVPFKENHENEICKILQSLYILNQFESNETRSIFMSGKVEDLVQIFFIFLKEKKKRTEKEEQN